MIYNFPTLQQGMNQTAFDIARPGIEQRIENNTLLAKDALLQRSVMGGTPGQMPMPPQDPSFGGFRAMGGHVMPGRSYVVGERPSGADNPVDTRNPTSGPPGHVWNAALKRWVPLKKDAVGGTTQWDVANFGKWNGVGTSQGPIGRGMGMPNGHTGLADFYTANPNQQPMAPGFQPTPAPGPFPAGPMGMKPDISNIPRRALGTPGPAPEQPGQPLVVGDTMDPATAAMMAAYTRDSYATNNGPLPELLVSPSGVDVVGERGPEVIVPTEPSYIIPNPQNVAAARTMGVPPTLQMGQIAQAPAGPAPMQLAAMPPGPAPMAAPATAPTGYQPIGSNYQPNQPGLQWTGSGFAHSPGGIRKTDIRRFNRSPEGVRFAVGQAADQQRMDNFMARDDARFDRAEQANTNDRNQAKADASAAKAERAAQDAKALEVQRRIAKAAASPEAYYTPEQLAVIESATDADGVKQAMEIFTKMNMERTKDKPDEITTQRLDGTNTMAIMRNGQLFNTTSRPEEPTQELSPAEVAELEAAGYNVTRKVGNATVSKPTATRQSTAPITTTRRLPGARPGDPETTETLQWKADEKNPNGGEWIPLPVAGAAAAAVPTWRDWAKSKKGA